MSFPTWFLCTVTIIAYIIVILVVVWIIIVILTIVIECIWCCLKLYRKIKFAIELQDFYIFF